MYPYIHLVLPSYGVLAFFGFFVVLLFLYFRTIKYNINFTDFLILSALCLIGGALGSKMLFIGTRIPWLVQNFSLLNLISLFMYSGFVFYGGLFGVLYSIFLYSIYHPKYELNRLLRFATPAIPLFHIFGRVGCFMAGCCYGVILSNPVTICGITFNRFPTQLLEVLFEVLIFVFLLFTERHSKFHPLQIYLIAYALFRFALEFFRGDIARGIVLGLSTSQWISLIILLYWVFKQVRQHFSFQSKHDLDSQNNPNSF